MRRKLLCHIFDQLVRRGVTDDERDDALAQVVVGHADHRDFPDAGMPEQRGFDLAGSHPEAAGLDQVHRFPTDDPVHSVTVDDGDVARPVPAVGPEDLGSGVGGG